MYNVARICNLSNIHVCVVCPICVNVTCMLPYESLIVIL